MNRSPFVSSSLKFSFLEGGLVDARLFANENDISQNALVLRRSSVSVSALQWQNGQTTSLNSSAEQNWRLVADFIVGFYTS